VREPITSLIPSTDGVHVAAHDYGGAGRLMFFVHGTGLVSRMWEPIMDRLGPTVRPVGIDLRGHGSATYPDDVEFHDHRMVSDMCAVLDHFGAKNAWAVAHSMGGGTSILTSCERPDALERLWVYEPIIFEREHMRPEGLFDFVEATKKRRPVFDSRADVIARYESRPPLDELHGDCLRAYVEHGFVDQPDGTVCLACDPLLESRAFEQYLQDGWDRLPQVTAAVRVGYGTGSEDRPATASPAIAERMPHGDADPFDGSGHFGCFGPLERAASSIADWFGIAP